MDRFSRPSPSRIAEQSTVRQVALVRTSTGALVAFLVGFAFSGAASRFVDRVDIVVKEANALGTAYLRADAIAEPQRGDGVISRTRIAAYTGASRRAREAARVSEGLCLHSRAISAGALCAKERHARQSAGQ